MSLAEKMKQNYKPQSFLLFLLLLAVRPTLAQRQPKVVENILVLLSASNDKCETNVSWTYMLTEFPLKEHQCFTFTASLILLYLMVTTKNWFSNSKKVLDFPGKLSDCKKSNWHPKWKDKSKTCCYGCWFLITDS